MRRTRSLAVLVGLGGFLVAGCLDAGAGPSAPPASCPDFPIEGFGKGTQGGCGGTVLSVTTLKDGGPGSLRHALNEKDASGQPQKRIIKFAVSGTIDLDDALVIRDPFVTLDGSDAPDGGIAIKGGKVIVRTSEVILRHLRLRPGPEVPEPGSGDGLVVDEGAANVVLDHLSVCWATDENLDLFRARQVSVQWSLICEGLNCANHPDGCHSKGAFISYGEEAATLSLHHNLFAFNADRNPLIEHGRVDFVNNVVYRRSLIDVVPDRFGAIQLNLVGNVVMDDGRGSVHEPAIRLTGGASAPASSVFLWGNVVRDLDGGFRPAQVIYRDRDFDAVPTRRKRHAFPRVTTTKARRAYRRVLAEAGASLPCRDAVDARVVHQVMTRTGDYLDHPADVGGWPDLTRPCP